ncbi:MAG: prephenate dehydratase, partial [Deltaproteobacteria bacterium]|nr:prephenate dehydratase [Deltaproteobacteria bacterium]
MRVAFQGERGAYSELACRAFFGDTAEPTSEPSFDAVFEAVEAGRAKRGVVPIENSLAGTIHRNYDLLLRHRLHLVGEQTLRISHCLIAAPGVPLEAVRVVRSHPQALAQCEARLAALGVATEPAYDTASAVRDLALSGRRDAAAIASRLAAEVHGMSVLKSDFEDRAGNVTRFLVLAREPLSAPGVGPEKTSLAFSLPNRPGGLFKALAVFALRDLDLTKIESRPLPGEAWSYVFYLDCVHEGPRQPVERALSHLEELCTLLRVFGTYPRHDEPD